MRAADRVRALASGLALVVALAAAGGCGGGASTPSGSASPGSGPGGPAAAARGTSAPPAPRASTSGAPPSPVPLHVVYSAPSAAFTPLFVGVDDGIFKAAGLQVSLSMAVGAPEMASLKSGEAQVATPGAIEIGGFNAAGGDAMMLATFSNYAAVSVYAPKGIDSMTQLSGKRVATLGTGTSPYAALQLFIHHYHLRQVQIIQVNSVPATLAAMQRGLADAAVLSAPTTARAAAAGYHVILNGMDLGVPFSFANLAVTRGYLAGHRATLVTFLKAYLKAWAFVRDPSHATACAAAIAHWTHVPLKLAQVAYRFFYPVWQKSPTPAEDPQAVQNVFAVNQNPKVRALSASSLIDGSLLDEAMGAKAQG